MGGSYKQCVECGKRALSIATRCPGCGREFPIPATPENRPMPAPAVGRFLTPRVVAGVLAMAGALIAAKLGRTSLPPEMHSPFVAEVQSSFVAAEASMAPTEVAYAARPVESTGELLVTRDWSSVRKGRSRRAELEAVLMPGDTVRADSLERGWYRVSLDGEMLGYVHRSLLRRR
jgi:hypothetical protein